MTNSGRCASETGDEFVHFPGEIGVGNEAEIAAGSGDGIPVVLGKFGGDEAGHGRFAGKERQDTPDGFKNGAGGAGRGQRNAAFNSGTAQAKEEGVDPCPEDDGCAVGDEVGAATGGMGGVGEGVEGEQVGGGGVADVGEVDVIRAVADDAQAVGAGEDARDEVRIASAPDEVRTQGGDAEAGGVVGGEDSLLGEGLGVRVGAGEFLAVGEGFVGAGVALAVEDDAGGAGVNEAGDGVAAAGGEDVLGAEDVGAEVGIPRAPDAGFGGDVKHGVAAGDGAVNSGGVGEIAGKDFDAAGGQSVLRSGRMGRAGEAADGVTAGDAEVREVAAEKAVGTGDKDFHGRKKIWEPQITRIFAEKNLNRRKRRKRKRRGF